MSLSLNSIVSSKYDTPPSPFSKTCANENADEIWMDTTFRDGQQAREPYTVEQIVQLSEVHPRAWRPKGPYGRQSSFVPRRTKLQSLRVGASYQYPDPA